MGDFAIIIPYFNPAGYRSHQDKFSRCFSALEAAGIAQDVYLAVAGPQKPEGGAKVTFWDPEFSFMWHKERLINLATATLPDRYSHVVWLDSDVIVDARWAYSVREAFTRSKIIQSFRTARKIGSDGHIKQARLGVLVADGAKSGSVGLAWGACRSLFTDGPGLFDLGLVGSGDSVFAHGMIGNDICTAPWLSNLRERLAQSWSPALQSAMHDWLVEASRWKGGSVAVAADSDIHVVEHGVTENRKYSQRHSLLGSLDPQKHLIIEQGRVFRWTPAGLASVEGGIRSYFYGRREDEPSGRWESALPVAAGAAP
ncbi:hypothetical protein [Kitasatospora sp. CB02891]|uniref:hypothetical protein n=1 Tax=Kitasatospora sp. CB02891 TaxID=2020329 RepID=UPI000C2793C3|nr:hypothetical protein [Kitasatospora sp. CB02891]PJN25675.1 hypothetical protein CG736_15015 [Kitasatospora sp. CB02891]